MLYIEITIEFNQKRRRIKKAKKKSPAKCPLLAALPMITQAAGAIGAVASAKKALDK